MDAVLPWILIFLVFGGWRLVAWAIRVGGGAASDAAKGQASFKEAVQARAGGMQPLEMRVKNGTIGEENLPVWKVEIRGLFHIESATELAVTTSLLDLTTDGDPHPILVAMEQFQEPETRAFQFQRGLGICEPGQGFLHWVEVGVIPKDLLIYPCSGDRKIAIVVRTVDQNNLPSIVNGFAPDHPGINQQFIHNENLKIERGYLEHSDDQLGVAAASLRLGLAVAFSDKDFDPKEGRVIKEWAAKFINEIPEGTGRKNAREFVNDAIRYGAMDAESGDLSISSQVNVLSDLADKPEKYAAIELCLDVMAADGSADREEMKVLNRLCDSLGLDPHRVGELRDRRLINVKIDSVEGSNIWETLSISESLSTEDKNRELRKLYRKWNAASEALEDEREREKAHQMIELIAEARKLLNA